MNQCYGYIRVSTVKQGEHGVSLQEQRAAITLFAERNNLAIVEWFEECVTAAKRGRPLFTKMMEQLRVGEAQGVVIHKIDRSARNLRDWADLGDLIDAGVSVHFANENLDLHSRGGRLTADIQAVIASDYVRNLREETLKGIRGRLKQGLCPFRAPLGYLDTGAGRAKTLDPVRAPLVREAFELYAAGRHTLDSLLVELYRRGLRNSRGKRLHKNRLSGMLNNPFYAGLVRLRSNGELFPGNHVPLVRMELFKRVEARLKGHVRSQSWKHDFVFRGLFRCSLCARQLIGERQKGHVYYRCHTSICPTRGFREEVLEAAVLRSWPRIAVTDEERRTLVEHLDSVERCGEADNQDRAAAIRVQLAGIRGRLTKLMDALLDGLIGKPDYEERKRSLLEEQRLLEDSLRPDERPHREKRTILDALELASTAQLSYELGNSASRRELVLRLTSNRSVSGQKAFVEPHPALAVLAKRCRMNNSAPYGNAARTLCKARWSMKDVWKIHRWAQRWLKRQTTDCSVS